VFALIFLVITTSGVNSLLLPSSPSGVTTGFSTSADAEAIFYNPANFASADNYKLWCSYNRFYLDMQSVSLALVKRIQSVNIGIAFVNFDYGDIELRPDYPSEDSITYYSANDFTLVVGGSVHLTKYGKFGLNVKYISETVYLYSDYALAFDITFAYGSPKYGISFGASDFGTRLTLRNEAVNLPARMSIGGYSVFSIVKASIDIHYLINNGDFECSFGAGIPVHDLIFVNAGVNYRESFYPGFGVDIMAGKLSIKYAGAIYPKNLGFVNTIGIGFDF
jgi:hypothetical protein